MYTFYQNLCRSRRSLKRDIQIPQNAQISKPTNCMAQMKLSNFCWLVGSRGPSTFTGTQMGVEGLIWRSGAQVPSAPPFFKGFKYRTPKSLFLGQI